MLLSGSKPYDMRALITALPLIGMFTLNAQVDVNKLIQERMARQQGAQAGDHGNVKIEDDNDPFVPNSFIGSFRMEMHHFQNGTEEKNSPTTMRYWSKADMTLTKMELPDAKGKDMRMMTDLKNKWQYAMVDDDKGKKTAIKTKKKKVVMDKSDEAGSAEVTVTKETKVIDGHTCTKVISKSKEGTWTGWVAQDMPAPFDDMLRSVRSGDPSMTQRMAKVKGFPLEFEWVDADGKSTMHCYMKDVVTGKVDDAMFSLDGYTVTDMTSMPDFGAH